MRFWSSCEILRVIDSVAIVIAQGYMLARSRLASLPSPVLQAAIFSDDAIWNAQLVERELAVFREERERVSTKQRFHYTPAHRFEILQIMRLRNWSAAQTAKRFALHPNTIRNWKKKLHQSGKDNPLVAGPVWNKIHDSVRWAVQEIRRLCPTPECGTRSIARHVVRAAVQISRSSVQRILREEPKRQRPSRPGMVPPEGAVPDHLLAPKKINKVWHVDLLEYRFLWFRFNVIGVVDGFSRKLLRLKIISGTAKTSDVLNVMQAAINSHGQSRFVITDHGSQFKDAFISKLENITVVKGKVRQPSFNGKIERLFKTLRIWLRLALLPISVRPLQQRFNNFHAWYNEHRPHAALDGRTPNEVWHGVELQAPIPIRQAEQCDVNVDVRKQRFRGDPFLPIVSVRITRKEAA